MSYRTLQAKEIIEPQDEVKTHGENFPGEGWTTVPNESIGMEVWDIHVGYYRRSTTI